MHKKIFFTIVAKNYISYARTLCNSIYAHHPDAKIYIGLSDKLDGKLDESQERFEIIEADQLDLPNASSFAFRYDVMEFSTAIKPYLFKWIFANTDAEQVVYLDPDILVVSPLVKVFDLLSQGASAVLTPHLLSRIDDNKLPNENTMLQVGVFNLGFIALSRHPETFKLVSWWCNRLERGAIVDLANGLFTDQKWADLMPCLFGDVAILRDFGYNAAYWNLSDRQIQNINGVWTANNSPLAFFHFSGVDPRNPEIFSKHQNRYMLNDIGELKELYKDYLNLLSLNGYFETRTLPYFYNQLNDGSKIYGPMRTYFKKMLDGGDNEDTNPFSLTSTYFNEYEPALGANAPVTRYMYGMYKGQPELQRAFSLDEVNGQHAYANWFTHIGKNVYSVDQVYIQHPAKATNEGGKNNDHTNSLLSTIKKRCYLKGYLLYQRHPTLARKLMRLLPDGFEAKLRVGTKRAIYTPVSSKSTSSDTLKKKIIVEDHVTLVGYAAGDFGVAENLRAVAGCLEAAKLKYDIYQIDTSEVYSKTNEYYKNKVVDLSEADIQLYCVNADQVKIVQSELGAEKAKDQYKIGYWFWELSKFPDDWLHAIDMVDEIWAPTQFVFDTLSKVTTKPIVHMPVAVDFKVLGQYSRQTFNLPDKHFLLLVSFDFHSFSTRKNASAALDAFKQAFPTNIQDVGLVIKTIHGEKHPEKYSELMALAKSDNRIHLFNQSLSRDEMYGLINVCSCYVSLHRSEGFGLGMAEAMLLGKPVIATAYSGNMDFMMPDNSCLIDYKFVDVKEGEYPFWQNQEWADPDIQQASKTMYEIYSDESVYQTKALKAKETISTLHSYEAVGKKIHDRLNAIKKELNERNI